MSDEARVLARHAGFYAAASLVSRGAAFLLIPILTRSLSAEEYGVLGMILVTSEVVGAAVGLRLGTAMSRVYFDYESERERAEVVTSTVLALLAVLAVVGGVLAALSGELAGLVLGDPALGRLMLLGMLGMVAHPLFVLGLGYLRLRERSGAYAVANAARTLLYLVATIVLVVGLGLGVEGALLGLLLANLLAAGAGAVPLLLALGPRFSAAKLREMLRFSLPMVPGELAELGVRFADRYLIVQLVSLAAAGWFFLAHRLTGLLHAILTGPFELTWTIRRIDAHAASRPDPEAAPTYTYFYVGLVTLALGLATLAPEVIGLLAPDAYQGAVAVLPLLALNEVVLSLVMIVELGLYFQKRAGRLAAPSYVTLAVHVALDLALIPLLGAVGAALAACLSSTIRVAVTARLARGMQGPRPEWSRLLAILAGAVGVHALARVLALDAPLADLALRVALCAAFPFAMAYTPLFGPADRRALLSLLDLVPVVGGPFRRVLGGIARDGSH